MRKCISTKKLILTALLMILFSCVVLCYGIAGNIKADALGAVPNTTTVGAIYNFDEYRYDKDKLDDLSSRILAIVGGTGSTVNDLITYTKNTAGESGRPIAGNSVVTLQYGRYRFSNKSSYKNLAWLPVYLSRSTSGDAILTLYLAATDNANKSTSQQEAGYFAHDGNYSTNTANEAPSNSYGTSFIRAVSLGNLTKYADYQTPGNTADYNKLYDASVKETNYNKFSDFIKGTDFTGVLYEDIATPSEVKWQADESYATFVNEGAYAGYCWPNEAYNAPSAGTYFRSTYFDYAQNNKINYTIWKNDKVWLPSLTEVGTGDIYEDYSGAHDTTNGIWKLTKSKRSNTINSWLRTANTSIDRGGGHSTFSMFAMDPDGALTTCDVNATCGIRPAIHLNLSRIIDKTIAPVKLPTEVKSVYTGDFQSMLSVPEDQRKWYNADDMTVYFYTDEACTKGTVPLNSGEYYLMVELKPNSKRSFFGELPSVKLKSTKFIVEKAKIGVRWVYEDTSQVAPPQSVEIVGQFYDRDINAQNVPTIGMKYSNITGAGIQNSPDWPDKIGWYKAVAYIVDDEIHSYNYELASEYAGGDKLESHQFEVLQKKIAQPVFKVNGETSLQLGYRGRQYIQIENILPQYVEVNINVVANGQTSAETEQKSQAALKKIVDMGVVDGVQTFSVEDVAKYTFTVTLKDAVNTVWENSGSDTSQRVLSLNIDKAEITVTFDGLPSSWEAARNVEFSVIALGLYDTGDNRGVSFNVSYYSAGNYAPLNVQQENGKYVFKPNSLSVGEYYIYVVMSGTSAYTSNYQMSNAATQKFTVAQTVANFTPAQVSWKYKVGGTQSTESYDYDTHNTESKALELPYVAGGFYEFSLSLTETQLSQRYLKATYSGDTYVTDAGMHCVTVVISAYDKNVDFTSQTYKIYFKIAASKYDLSDIRWDYENPFTYSGSEHKVKILPETLPAGLTVVYNTGGFATNAATDAGSYVTAVVFRVSEEYAKNYLVPDVLDPTSYINDGSFSFTCNWVIDKQEIIANWNTDSSSSSIFFVPILQVGHNLVNYTYEHKEGSNWVACSSIASTASSETYRVTAAIKPAQANNYILSGTTDCEFEVVAGQYAVTMHVEINGVRHADGDTFPYDGSTYEATPVAESPDISISAFTVKYYPIISGIRGAQTAAPVNAGKYVAVIDATLSGGTELGFNNQTEFNFEIVKADIDLSALRLVYTHNGITLSARWDTDQQKWVDSASREVTFDFEYDGTKHEIQLVGDENVDGFTVNSFTGNYGINAGSNTAFIDYVISSDYNEPALAKTLNWKISQASVNFENVKWGYIDSDGNEHEFGENGAQFVFTRDDEKNSVKFTVALINLPDYLKPYFKYVTTSYTDHDFDTKNDNSFSAIGEYHTTVMVSGSYTDPTNNRKPFSDSNFPENISRSIDWDILPRELSEPKYDGSWIVFDDRIHDLVELSGIPKDELNYFSVEITFMDKSNNIYNDYQGYDNVPFAAREAGTYIVSFYELLIKFNGVDYDDKVQYVWGQVEIEVDKAELEVAWDRKGAIPVAMVKGIYVSDMLGTMYYPMRDGSRGAPVTVEYIKTTNGEVSFEAEPYVTSDYANNLGFVMANGEVPVYSFSYERFQSDKKSVPLKVPVMDKLSVEYTGRPITFSISNWDFDYKDYLYIVEGAESLTQTDVGVYHITVSFIKYDKNTNKGNAYWEDTDDDRSSKVLTFEITAPTRIALDFPEFNKYSSEYTGSPIEFKITNIVLLRSYVDYEVFYKGDSLGKNIDLKFTGAGIYTVTFTFKEGSKGYWVGEPDSKVYRQQIQIIDSSSGVQEIRYPQFQTPSKEYTGEQLEFVISNWDSYYNMHIEIVSVSNGATFTGGTFKATERNEYEVLVRIKNDLEIFDNGTKEYRLKFTIAASSTGANVFNRSEIKLSKVSNAEYRVDNWSSFGNNLVVTCENPNVTVSGGTVTANRPGTYTVLVNIKSGSGSSWSDGGEDPVELTFTVADTGTDTPVKQVTLASPVLEKAKIEYNGNEITFVIKSWDSVLKNYVTIENGSLTHINAGKYTVTLRIIDSTKAVWEGGSTADVPLSFEIVPARLKVEKGEDGRPRITNLSGDEVNINDYLDPHYYDPETGEEVPVEKCVNGKTYDVSYKIKPENEEEFKKNVENSSAVQNTFDNEKFNFVFVKTQGLSPIMIITIAIVGVLVLLVLATVIVLAVKRRQYAADYDDDYYDDYDDDYDD